MLQLASTFLTAHVPPPFSLPHFLSLQSSPSSFSTKMKRKSAQRAATTAVATDIAVVVAETTTKKQIKNLRSKLPRRKRALISPLLFDLTTSKPPVTVTSTSFNSTCDNVSCNTTLASVVETVKNDVNLKPIGKVTVDLSISETSCVESCSILHESNCKSVIDVFPTEISGGNLSGCIGSDLTCKEEFSYDEYEVSSNYEFQSEIFSGEFDDFESTDEYTPSIWLNSGSQFSKKSFGDDTSPSLCFSLFKEFQKQFLELQSPDFSDLEASSQLNDAYSNELAYRRFEEQDEESYQTLRNRERNQRDIANDYMVEYEFATEFSGLITEQRLLMVNWIIDISRKNELQNETMFLGVRLFDRFLSHGFFKTRKNLQLLGIACLTLATRIEENQPYNSVRQKTFYVGSNTYSRTEVVAMEWVVQEVLKFQCISPTIHNFLWFYLKVATANEEMKRKVKYIAALALLDHKLLQFSPSTVAAALVILVALSKDQQESCLRVAQTHVRSKIDDLPECVKSLEWMMQYLL